MVARRLLGVVAALGSAALIVGTLGASATPALAAGPPGPPKPPSLCSLVPNATYSSALGIPVPLVVGRVTTGRKAITALAKQSDIALTSIFAKASKITTCANAVGGGPGASGPGGAGPPTGPPPASMNLTFFNNVTRKTFLAAKRNFQIESGSGSGTGVAHYAVADVPGVGDAAYTLGLQPAPDPNDLPYYDVFVLVGSTQIQVDVAGTAPDPAKVQTLAGALATALRKHGSS
jgi:hypothetical protein